MFKIDDDMTINVTRGDCGTIDVSATVDGAVYVFLPGDILRLKVFEKKNCENVVLKKDFGIDVNATTVTLTLTGKDTKIGGMINKPTNYWYEIELNPETNPQTIVGYDDEGPKLFCLHPEGNEVGETEPEEADVGAFDDKLDLTSNKALPNWVIAQAFYSLQGKVSQYPTDVISVGSWGIVGDGKTDVTDKINAIFESLKGGETVYFPDGTYKVSAQPEMWFNKRYHAIKIQNKDNVKVILSPNAKIKCEKVNFTPTQVSIFFVWNCNNFEITGGIIDGGWKNGDTNNYEFPENGKEIGSGMNGVEVRNGDHVYIHDMTLYNCYGDGLFISPFYKGANNQTEAGESLQGGLIDNCYVHNCARNGISIEGTEGFIIRNCLIHTIDGHDAKLGIDLECEFKPSSDDRLRLNKNCLIDNCAIYDCPGGAVAISTGSQNTTISNCNFYSCLINQTNSEQVGDLKIINTKFGWLGFVRNCIAENCEIGTISTSSIEKGTAKGYFKNCFIKGDENGKSHIISLKSYGDSVVFDGCVFLKDDPKFTTTTINLVNRTSKADTEEQPPFKASFKNCQFYIWDNMQMFEVGNGYWDSLELIACNFMYNTSNSIRPLIAVILPLLKMIDCVVHCEKIPLGMSNDFGSTYGLVSVRQDKETCNHIIVGNKIISNGLLKTFVTFKSDVSSGTTYLFNNFSNVEKINNNKPSGILKAYGNVTSETLEASE